MWIYSTYLASITLPFSSKKGAFSIGELSKYLFDHVKNKLSSITGKMFGKILTNYEL